MRSLINCHVYTIKELSVVVGVGVIVGVYRKLYVCSHFCLTFDFTVKEFVSYKSLDARKGKIKYQRAT
jgi:hypothetical protein